MSLRRATKSIILLPHMLAVFGSLASVLSFIVSTDNDLGRSIAIAISSMLAFVGYYLPARDETPALPELILAFGVITVLLHLIMPPTVLSALAQVLCMIFLALMSNRVKLFFLIKPKLSVVFLFLPISMFGSSFLMMNHWIAYNILKPHYLEYSGKAKTSHQFEIRGSMVVANTWEEMLRLGTYLSGVTNPYLSGLLWASGHSLPEASRAGKTGVDVPNGNEDIFKIWVGLAFLCETTIYGAILLFILKLTGSFWNVLLIHMMTNLFGFSITVGPELLGILLSGTFLALGGAWLVFQLRYLGARFSQTGPRFG
ncbi:hypothetical protein Mrub_0343 [Meiothermus ruber DSM 1279]|uniref:Uncharacterized protein n=2 Tax=Meiothermus ruber TaxID=277 RepID=A0A806CQ63_MEIRD|nr:hypothetical protein Mrub_0343 [Meiothermus ruber DSM 1279]